MDKLKIFTTGWCPDCHKAKRFLENKGIEFEEVDIEENPEAVDIVVAARGKRVVPTLEYKGKYIDGNHFSVEKFEADLATLLS
ncbi:MAG: glutaredoxin family protein [Nitrospinota bacterium]|nr:glutaredoxin family protein [Nitrospinota bacterium]